jgi:hypothetical protein
MPLNTWASGVGGFLTHHHVPDFLQNLEDLRAADEEDQKWAGFLAMWRKKFGTKHVRAREVFASAHVDTVQGVDLDPWDGMFITDKRSGRRPKTAVQLGQWITGHIDRFHGELRLRSEYDRHNKVTWYWVEEHIP